MRTGVPIILFVAVAGFHNAISASLAFDESNKSSEERVYEGNITTTQQDESEYAAANVNVTEDILRTTHMAGGETEALTDGTEEADEEESEETKVLKKKYSDVIPTDGETEALTVEAGEPTGSDVSADKHSEEDEDLIEDDHEESQESV